MKEPVTKPAATMPDFETLYEEALKLPEGLRELMAHRLLVSIYGDEDVDRVESKQSHRALQSEIRRRWEAYQRGEIPAVPLDEVFPELKEKAPE